jgi:haloalkane dehalogenase
LPFGAFPFRSHFFEHPDCKLHYVDEGQGATILMVHGNPTWSYVYRHVIKALRGQYRCIAVDLPGFGLSKAAGNFNFEANAHAKVLEALLEKLDIKNAALVAHDWGGPIGLAAGLKSRRVKRLCLGNTWAWPVNGEFHFEWFARLMGGPIGRYGTRRHAFFINLMMPASMKRKKLTGDDMKAYRAPFANGQDRTPMMVFPQEILAAGDWLAEIEELVRNFSGPSRMIWPENDVAFRQKELKRWQKLLPNTDVVKLAKCGHYLWEDAPEDCAHAIGDFMRDTK